MRTAYISFAAAFGLAALACAGAPVPTERMASAQASLRAAKEVGAKDVPKAQLHAQLAQEQVDHASKLIKEGENERAEMILRRAQADAELAVALAREANTQKRAELAEAALSPTPGQPPQTMQATAK